MTKSSFFILFFAGLSGIVLGQLNGRKLATPLNHPSFNYWAPFVSLDGNSMTFLCDNAEDDLPTVFFTTRQGADWREPVMMAKIVNNRISYLKATTLSPDGKTLYITTFKSGGPGGYDIWYSLWKGYWTDPINFGLPINSTGHEGSPTFTYDGQVVYFMRCDKLTQTSADGCKIMMAMKRPNGSWEPPVELDPSINAGNSQFPRITGDGQTLIFSSNRHSPGKGGMDLYHTRWDGEKWSKPVPLEFANTAGDDQFASVSSLGRYLVKDAMGPKKNELVELLFPSELKPKVSMKIVGQVEGIQNTSAYVTVFNRMTQKRISATRTDASGAFMTYLVEGDVYDLSIDPEADNFTFYSRIFDLTGGKVPVQERVNAQIKPVGPGDVLELAGTIFLPNSNELDPVSNLDLRRSVRLIKSNPGLNFNIDVTLLGYLQDSVKSGADLTEVIADTLRIPVEYPIEPFPVDTIMTDSTFTMADSTSTFTVMTETRDSLVIKYTYHNNRTKGQAEKVMRQMIVMGVPKERLSVSFRAITEAIPENRKTIVKIIAR